MLKSKILATTGTDPSAETENLSTYFKIKTDPYVTKNFI